MTRNRLGWAILLAGFASLLLLCAKAKAQDDQSDQNDQDPPGRVARLSYAQGSVSFRPGGEEDWITAVPNRPMVSGDDLWADEDSRAEAHVGSTAIRLGAKTGITFLAVDDRTTQIRLAQGSLVLRVRHVDDDDIYEVDTPNLAFTLLQPGDYRIDVSPDGNQTITTVWHGRGRVTGGGFSHTVLARQSATFTGTDQLEFDLAQLPEEDDLDRWSFERDDREDRDGEGGGEILLAPEPRRAPTRIARGPGTHRFPRGPRIERRQLRPRVPAAFAPPAPDPERRRGSPRSRGCRSRCPSR